MVGILEKCLTSFFCDAWKLLVWCMHSLQVIVFNLHFNQLVCIWSIGLWINLNYVLSIFLWVTEHKSTKKWTSFVGVLSSAHKILVPINLYTVASRIIILSIFLQKTGTVHCSIFRYTSCLAILVYCRLLVFGERKFLSTGHTCFSVDDFQIGKLSMAVSFPLLLVRSCLSSEICSSCFLVELILLRLLVRGHVGLRGSNNRLCWI